MTQRLLVDFMMLLVEFTALSVDFMSVLNCYNDKDILSYYMTLCINLVTPGNAREEELVLQFKDYLIIARMTKERRTVNDALL